MNNDKSITWDSSPAADPSEWDDTTPAPEEDPTRSLRRPKALPLPSWREGAERLLDDLRKLRAESGTQ